MSGSLTIDIMENNLSYMRTGAPLLAPIFRSDGQARLLSALLLTGDELSLTDLAERAALAYPTAHREVGRLLDSGILRERHVGRTRLIRANDESPLVDPLREILTVVTGPVVILAEELARIEGVEAAVHRPVNPTILTLEEFAATSGFLDNVRSGSAVAVIGELPWH